MTTAERYKTLLAKIAKADALSRSKHLPAGSLSAWFAAIADGLVTFDRRDRRNARDRARRARQRKGGEDRRRRREP